MRDLGDSEPVDNHEGKALLAHHHRGAGTPKAEFAGLMSIAGYASFEEACALWDAAPVHPAAPSGRNDPSQKLHGL